MYMERYCGRIIKCGVEPIMELKDVFISNNNKLLAHCMDLARFQQTGKLVPWTLDVAPTNRCNQNCEDCSVKNRDQSQELTFEQVVTCTSAYHTQGIKSVEITGGGEPTCWKALVQYLQYVHELNLPIGLITNGRLLHEYSYENFWKYLTWIRVSLTGIDQNWKPHFRIPSEFKGTFSFSYVWTKHSTDETIQELEYIMNRYPQAEALKVQMNVFDANLEYPTIIHPKAFVVEKDHEKAYPSCYMGWLKPHLDADGYLYRCSTCALRDRKFPMEWRIGKWDHIPEAYPEQYPFETKACDRCFYTPQNQLLYTIRHPCKHSEFA